MLFRGYLRDAMQAGAKDTTRRLITAENSTVQPGTFDCVDFDTGRGGRLTGEIRAQCRFESGRVRVVTVAPVVRRGDLFWAKAGRFGARAASRLTLEVREVRAARVQDMTDEDALREGVEYVPAKLRKAGTPRDWFGRLWDDINGEDASWAKNPWVWVYRFDVKQAQIDHWLRGADHYP